MPSEIAPIAAGKIASELPITACAPATSQNFGNKDMTRAPPATATAAATISARFHRVQSISAPKGRARRHGGDAGDHHHNPDAARVPVLGRQKINREEGAKPIFHVGKEKIELVEGGLHLHEGAVG